MIVARPATPALDQVLKEFSALFDWWLHGPRWHFILLMAILWVACAAFAKALCSTDKRTVQEEIKDWASQHGIR